MSGLPTELKAPVPPGRQRVADAAVDATNIAVRPYPSGMAGWYVVIVLMIAYIVSLIDRNVVGLLIEPIKGDLHLNDLHVGLLLGAAFALFYSTLGIPMGMLADRLNRPRLIGAGMLLWCVMTVMCGLAQSFGALFVARLGVGVGEAVLAPAALSLISDYFPKHRRARAISVFWTGTLLGTGFAFLVGGPLISHVNTWTPVTLPLVGDLKPWQTVLMIVGAPGIVIALLIAFSVREPPRRERLAAVDAVTFRQSFALAFAHLRSEARTFGRLMGGMGCIILVGYTALWTAPLFTRTWGWDIKDIGVAMGILVFAAAIPGTTFSGWWADRARARGKLDGPLQSAAIGAAVMLPGYTLYPLMPTGELALGCLYVALFGQAMASAAGPTAILHITPGDVRGQVSSMYMLCIILVGLLIGPPLVGALTDLLGGAAQLRYSLALVGAVVGVIGLLILVSGRNHYRASAARADL